MVSVSSPELYAHLASRATRFGGLEPGCCQLIPRLVAVSHQQTQRLVADNLTLRLVTAATRR